jgi:hypothetical protein
LVDGGRLADDERKRGTRREPMRGHHGAPL